MTPSQTIWKGVCIIILLCWKTIYALANEAENYDFYTFTTVQRTAYPHFIMFYAPWCAPCTNVMPVWNKFAAENHEKRRMKIGKVDCTESTPLCASEKIKAYPTFCLYHKQKKFTFRESRSIFEFNKFIDQNLPNLPGQLIPETGDSGGHSNKDQKTTSRSNYHGGNVIVLTGENFEMETEQGLTFVDFFAPWCSHCRKLEPVWKQLAETYAYDDRVKIAKVDCTADPELCQRKSITAYPSLHLYKDGNMISEYNFDRSLNGLIDFVNKALAFEEPETTVPERDLPPPPNEPTPLKADVKWYDRVQIIETLFYQPLCVYMHDPTKPNSAEKLLIFEEFGKKLADSLSSSVDAVLFDCTADEEFCNEHQAEGPGDSPIIVYFKSSLHDYVIFGQSEEITISNLLAFVEKETTNSNKDEL